MSDRLDAVVQTAAPLLKRVDEVLSAAGAPPDHAVWPSLRRVRLLPWDAVQAVAALRPADLTGAAEDLRADAATCVEVADSLPRPPGEGWSGSAADAYDSARVRATAHLNGEDDSLHGRLTATAELADGLVAWMSQARAGLAMTLAEILVSAEALALSRDAIDPTAADAADAAAQVAARVLEAVAGAYDEATDLMATTAPLTAVRWS